MKLDYFYGQEADQFTFYRIPKVLFTDERFRPLSAEAKLLYGLLLDRMALSQRNGWFDDQNRVYIIFTIEDGKAALGCAEQKIIKLLNELEKKGNLIERKRQGLGKPNLIYVKNFVESQIMNCENHNSGAVKTTTQELPKSQCNNTDNINTDFSDTDPFLPSELPATHRMGADGNGDWQKYYQYFLEELEFDVLLERYPLQENLLHEILNLIVDTVCTRRKLIRIASDDKPVEIVRSQFMKLTAEHICYVVDCFQENTTNVRNVKQYLLTAIYNAPLTIDAYYTSRVSHDMAEGNFC